MSTKERIAAELTALGCTPGGPLTGKNKAGIDSWRLPGGSEFRVHPSGLTFVRGNANGIELTDPSIRAAIIAIYQAINEGDEA